MSDYRYQLERYRGRGTRYVCPQCGRKYSFTRYIDTHNNNEYVNERVGKCNRLDKCGYHYTPKQYYTDNPWKRESCSFVQNHRVYERTNKRTELQPEPYGLIPRWFMERTLDADCDYKRWHNLSGLSALTDHPTESTKTISKRDISQVAVSTPTSRRCLSWCIRYIQRQ